MALKVKGFRSLHEHNYIPWFEKCKNKTVWWKPSLSILKSEWNAPVRKINSTCLRSFSSFWVNHSIYLGTATDKTNTGLVSDGGSGRSLLRIAGGCGRGLSRQRVHGSQELIGDATGLSEPAEQGAVNRGRVVSDGVLAGKEQARNRLWKKKIKKFIYIYI